MTALENIYLDKILSLTAEFHKQSYITRYYVDKVGWSKDPRTGWTDENTQTVEVSEEEFKWIEANEDKYQGPYAFSGTYYRNFQTKKIPINKPKFGDLNIKSIEDAKTKKDFKLIIEHAKVAIDFFKDELYNLNLYKETEEILEKIETCKRLKDYYTKIIDLANLKLENLNNLSLLKKKVKANIDKLEDECNKEIKLLESALKKQLVELEESLSSREFIQVEADLKLDFEDKIVGIKRNYNKLIIKEKLRLEDYNS